MIRKMIFREIEDLRLESQDALVVRDLAPLDPGEEDSIWKPSQLQVLECLEPAKSPKLPRTRKPQLQVVDNSILYQ